MRIRSTFTRILLVLAVVLSSPLYAPAADPAHSSGPAAAVRPDASVDSARYTVSAFPGDHASPSLTGGLKWTIDRIRSKKALLVLPGNHEYLIDRNLTVPGNVTLSPEPGAILKVASGKTLTIAAAVPADIQYQIFDFDPALPSPVIRLKGNGNWRTSWFLGSGSDPSKNVKALQIMFDGIGNGTILFDKSYLVNASVTMKSLVSIRGNGKNGKAALGLAPGANCSILFFPSGAGAWSGSR